MIDCCIEVLDPRGHLMLQWDPDDPKSVDAAETEWKRLKDAGFAFFAEGKEVAALADARSKRLASVDAHVVQVEAEAVKPRRGRRGPKKATAVPRMRGG